MPELDWPRSSWCVWSEHCVNCNTCRSLIGPEAVDGFHHDACIDWKYVQSNCNVRPIAIEDQLENQSKIKKCSPVSTKAVENQWENHGKSHHCARSRNCQSWPGRLSASFRPMDFYWNGWVSVLFSVGNAAISIENWFNSYLVEAGRHEPFSRNNIV